MKKADSTKKEIENMLRLYPYMLVFINSYNSLKIPSSREVEEKSEIYKMIIDIVEQTMKILNANERKFIELRYFENWSIIKIAIDMNYSEQMIFQIRKNLLEKLTVSFLPLIECRSIKKIGIS